MAGAADGGGGAGDSIVDAGNAGGQPGYAASEVGVGGVGAGSVIVDAACEGGAGDHSTDAVGVGCAVVVSGFGGVGDADGDVGVGGAPGTVSLATLLIVFWRFVPLVVLRW